MTDLLLAYLCVGLSVIGALEISERWSAARSRQFQRDVFTDLVEAQLLLVEEALGLPEKADHVVTRTRTEDHAGDEQDLEPDLFHGLIMRNGADS